MSPLERFNKYRFLCKRLAGILIKQYSSFCRYNDVLYWGEIGLWKACIKYQERVQGDRFEFYASQCIRGSIIDEIRHTSPFPRSMKNRPKIVDIDDEQITQEVLPVDEQVDRKMLVEKTLLYALDLNERERDVINLYFGEGLRSVEIAEHFGLSEPRISQIKRVALEKLAVKLSAFATPNPQTSYRNPITKIGF